MDPFIGQIIMFGGNFAPRGWALCDGQLLSINSHSALFSILGTTYGGDGRSTFGLPDLRGRLAMHAGTGPGLTPRNLGAKSGAETVTLTANQIAPHSHPISAAGNAPNEQKPTNHALGAGDMYIAETPEYALDSRTIGNSTGGQPHNNVPPFQVVNFIIALQGTYPSRN